MDLVTNFLLLAASGVACLYCVILSRRLKGLTDAKGGLGAGVAALSRSAEEMKAALTASRKSAEEAAARLEAALADAGAKEKEIRKLMEALGETGAAVAAHAEGATRKYLDALAPILDEAATAADRLFAAIEEAPKAAPLQGGQAQTAAEKIAAARERIRRRAAA